jgi:hypothetical protein
MYIFFLLKKKKLEEEEDKLASSEKTRRKPPTWYVQIASKLGACSAVWVKIWCARTHACPTVHAGICPLHVAPSAAPPLSHPHHPLIY